MRRVPFYANHEDNNHCMPAVYRSIIQFFTGKRMTWQEADELVGYRDGRAAWSVQALVKMAAMGFDVRMIENFDYRAYAERGRAYLEEHYPKEELDWYLRYSNILDIQHFIPEFLQTVNREQRRPTLEDIDAMLAEGRLVSVTLNSCALNDMPGHAVHAVLVIHQEDDAYIIHDPGLPPRPERRVSRDQLWQAMGGEQNTAEMVGFKLARGLGGRLDNYVVTKMPRLSRTFAAKLIGDGDVLVNGKPSKPGYKVRIDDAVTIDYDESILDTIEPITLPVLYEDDDCVVVDKPAGVLTHSRGGFSTEGTVASWLRSRLHNELGGDRGGIVHRLDRATSGVMICARTPAALSFLQKQFSARTAKKTYMAVVAGRMPHEHAIIDMPIARDPRHPQTFRAESEGRQAVTEYWVRGEGNGRTLLELSPRTGRTHQLRVHLSQIGHPIIGDPLYGGQPGDRLYLHAERLEIALPNGQRRTFESPLPAAFRAMIEV